ncbi:MAG: hypothetical protein KDC98_12710 [Planctomycetes bacterium]|nr:hypothetical protein [Planctomycetota bacterium]
MRIVLYAEGPGEDRGESAWLPAPGEPLSAQHRGAAHHLVARLLDADRGIPQQAVQFVSPLRYQGKPHRGSDLLQPKRLRRLLTFAAPTKRPQLAIVFIDEDGVSDRKRQVEASTAGLDLPRVIAVPVREFEAWLIADPRALADHLGIKTTPSAPESMARGQAKQLLQQWIAEAMERIPDQTDLGAHTWGTRRDLALNCDLEALGRLGAFQRFRGELRAVASSIR